MNSKMKTEQWYAYLYYTENVSVNMERVESVGDITGREALQYTLKSLDLLEHLSERTSLTLEKSSGEYQLVEKTLQWSEVAKGGTVKDREEWLEKGYPLDIHNIASAEIFAEYAGTALRQEDIRIIYTLIRTHGMIGQSLRGEVPMASNAPLLELIPILGEESLRKILYALNYCIIGAVNLNLWAQIGDKVFDAIDRILRQDLSELPAGERVRALLPGLPAVGDELVDLFAGELFPKYELWYFEAALSDFSEEQIQSILRRVIAGLDGHSVEYITFKPLADSLYYDYEGKKHINVYKKRIIEKYLRDEATLAQDPAANVWFEITFSGNAAIVNLQFSKVCEKLIDFCVEAERSGLLTFEKSITVLYDMFGFRRDEFDRLNNETKYLETMNDTEQSTKNSIIDYAVGECVVDVGSGGGILLDLLERTYPDKQIIGTDISENVIEVLEKKKVSEGHAWTVRKHNFVEGPFDTENECPDTIIFSSILHEIFSYTETEDGRFNIESVKLALENAYASIRPGGRIIIRDGIKTGSDVPDIKVTFADRSGLDFFENYVRDFKGLRDIEDKRISIDREHLTVSGCANYIREFLYTYTWGQESYAHEVQEQFGYFTPEEFEEFFAKLGARVIKADAFLEPGYKEHLSPLVTLLPPGFPDSNCIIVAEKPQ